MIQTIRVTSSEKTDAKGLALLAEIEKTLKIKSISNIKTIKVYRLEGLEKKDAEIFAKTALVEAINQNFTINEPIINNSQLKIEVAYKPGVMNPEVESILKSSKNLSIPLKAADSSYEYAFFGKVTKSQINEISQKILLNETVEHVIFTPPKTLLITGKTKKIKTIPIRKLNNDQLITLSKDRLFLNLEEMKIIQNYFNKIKREPTDCEIEVLAQTWSEHCVHKTFNAKLIIDGQEKTSLYSRIKKTAKYNKDLIISAFVDNSGVIDFYDGFAISGKVETHNSPSAIEPYGGAMTGSGGVFRDILGTGQGAKPIASTDIFCFAPPNLKESKIPPGCLAPEYILRNVVAGVRDYGNRVGIPTNNGSIHFHEDFRAKPTVAVGSYGLIVKTKAKKKNPKPGDLIFSIGGSTGRDGIHGATFSSGEMTSKTMSVSGSAVQIGNPIEEKRVIDLVLDLSHKNLIRTLTDCGAGGYSSAVGEMGKNTGVIVNLENVPLKYSNLAPWEMFLSESQERMVLAIKSENLKKVQSLCKLYNVNGAVIGKFTNNRRLKVKYKKQTVCDLTMQFLHNGLPQRIMIGNSSKVNIVEQLPPKPQNYQTIWQNIMAHGNICSKEPIVRLYDHNVQGTNALHPFAGVNYDGPNDGVVLRPILNKYYGVAISHGINPTLNKIDPYWGSVWAILEAVSNFIAIGGEPNNAALIDNFIWPFPDEESLADLDKSTDACADIAKILKMSFVSGKDSLSSTYRYPDGKILKIPPVLLVSVFGRIPDVRKTVSSDFKKVGSTIVLVGKPDYKNLGGSTYFDLTNSQSINIPKPDLSSINSVFSSITKGIKSGDILSCHDISEGGIAAALAEMCFGAGFGAEININKFNTREDYVLFSESPGTLLVEVDNAKIANKLFEKVPHTILGKTVKSERITVNGFFTIKADVNQLKKYWQKPMKEIFH